MFWLPPVIPPIQIHPAEQQLRCTHGYAEEWLEIKALRCEEQLREVIDFIRGFGSQGQANYGGLATAAPEHVLQLFLGQLEESEWFVRAATALNW